MADRKYDVIIIGAGPAGITAALYGERLGLKTVVFGDIPGGNVYMIENMMNYPGFLGGVPGTQFGVIAHQQAAQEGATFTMTRMERLGFEKDIFLGTDVDGKEYIAPTAIAATGRVPKRLPVSNPHMRGIHFCSICDGPLFRGQDATLAVIGSDNAAGQHALNLARVVEKVFLICRSEKLKMDAAHRNLIVEKENIVVLLGTEVSTVKGKEEIQALIASSLSGESSEIPVDGVFMAIGWKPTTEMLDMDVETTPEGYIKTDERFMTSFPGLFAAGDVRDTDIYQVLTSCADGARAANYVLELLESRET